MVGDVKRENHIEFEQYLLDREIITRCRRAVEVWRHTGETIQVEKYGLAWTYPSAREFIRSLSDMFRAYNQVLWEMFPFCRLCKGQCCTNGASFVSLFDGLAMALLELSLPELGEEIEAHPDQCIDLSSGGCSWPAEWVDFKCRLFWCLGPEGRRMEAPAAQQVYAQMTGRLEDSLRSHLPETLKMYERVAGVELVHNLEDPLGFTERLGEALDEIFTEAALERWPELWDDRRPLHYLNSDQAENHLPPSAQQALNWIAEAVEIIYQAGGENGAEQLLSDLELLEVIALGQERGERLEELSRRYGDTQETEMGSRIREIVEMLANEEK